jgi:nicotinamidase-related amidase
MKPWSVFSPGAAELAQILQPSRTALLVIDIQNDFAHPDGVMARMGVDMSTVEPAVAASERLVQAARTAGLPVVFIALETSAALDSRAAILRRARLGQADVEDKRVCRKSKWGAEWYRLVPEATDIRVSKARYASFQDTELDLLLRARGVDTLVVCGLTTECCVETAVRDAFHRDYNVFLAEDACAAYDPQLHETSVRTMAIYHALIVTSDLVCEAWTKSLESFSR